MKNFFKKFVIGLIASLSFFGQAFASGIGGGITSTTYWYLDGTTLKPVNATWSVSLPVGGTSDGVFIIDASLDEAFLVRKDGDTGDIFIVDTTNSEVEVSDGASLSIKDGQAVIQVDDATNKIAVDIDNDDNTNDPSSLRISNAGSGRDIDKALGVLRVGGSGATNNEDLVYNYEATANAVGVSSTTGVIDENYTGIDINTTTEMSAENLVSTDDADITDNLTAGDIVIDETAGVLNFTGATSATIQTTNGTLTSANNLDVDKTVTSADADGTRHFDFLMSSNTDPAASAEVNGGYFAINKTAGSNGTYTYNALEGVVRSQYADENMTARGVYGRVYIDPTTPATLKTGVGVEASARASYSGGTEIPAEAGTAFVGERIWMAPYFSAATVDNVNNFWGLWIYGEHTTQRNGDAAIKIGDAGGGFTNDLNLQHGTKITNDIAGDLIFKGDGATNDEDLKMDFETVANAVGFSSSTGVLDATFTGIDVNTTTEMSAENLVSTDDADVNDNLTVGDLVVDEATGKIDFTGATSGEIETSTGPLILDIADDFLQTPDNKDYLAVNIPVTGTDATAHMQTFQIDGLPFLYASATGDGAGGVGVNTVNLGVGSGADVVHIGDANALVDITDAHWSITEAGVASFASIGSGDIAISDATPIVQFKDTDATAGDVNASIQADATDTGNGTEDIDVTFMQQVAGATVNWLVADADGDITINSATDDIILDPEGLGVVIGDNGDEDYSITFDSDTADGSISWNEDNNKFDTSTLSATSLLEGANAVPNATDTLAFFSATTSAQLYGVLSDETGSGGGTPLAVFNYNPTLTGVTLAGDVTSTGAAYDWDLVDANASALSFDTDGKAGLIEIDTSTGAEGVKMSGYLTLAGDLTVNGTTTTINSTTLTVDDKNIVMGDVASPTDTTADGGGIELKGATDKTILWDNTNDNWTSSDHFNLAASHNYKIANTDIIADSAGTATLSNIDAIDATTETTFESAIDALANLVTTGALNSGSITNGFGAIDIGADSVTAGSVYATGATAFIGGEDVAGGSPNVAGLLKLFSAGDNAYYSTLTAGTNTSNAAFILPVDEPAGTYLMTMTSGGQMAYDSSDYVATADTGTVTAKMLQNAAADLGAANIAVNLGNTNGSYVTNLTTDGTITGGTLTDGTASITGGAVSGVTTLGAGATTLTSASTPLTLQHNDGTHLQFKTQDGVTSLWAIDRKATTNHMEFTTGNAGYYQIFSPGTTQTLQIAPNDVDITGVLGLLKAGTAKATTDLFELTNSGNAADMDATGTGILFNQYYYDASTPAVADAGRIAVLTEQDWTSTGTTQDSAMSFMTALDGTVGEKMSIASNGMNLFTLIQEDVGATCTLGQIRYDTGGAADEICYCQATNTWMCTTVSAGPVD